jgi:hypothetical protein
MIEARHGMIYINIAGLALSSIIPCLVEAKDN